MNHSQIPNNTEDALQATGVVRCMALVYQIYAVLWACAF